MPCASRTRAVWETQPRRVAPHRLPPRRSPATDLAEAARRPFDVLSGDEKARLGILILELEGHDLLLLDEPTDDLDIDSSQALEAALDGFTGTVAVSHDRGVLRALDRHLMMLHDGTVVALPDFESALEPLLEPAGAADVRLAKVL